MCKMYDEDFILAIGLVFLALFGLIATWMGLYKTHAISWPFYDSYWDNNTTRYRYIYSRWRLNPGVSI